MVTALVEAQGAVGTTSAEATAPSASGIGGGHQGGDEVMLVTVLWQQAAGGVSDSDACGVNSDDSIPSHCRGVTKCSQSGEVTSCEGSWGMVVAPAVDSKTAVTTCPNHGHSHLLTQ